jgi:hypothetical protein
MTEAAIHERQGFHLVEPSAWPIIGAGFAFLTALGLILFMITFMVLAIARYMLLRIEQRIG